MAKSKQAAPKTTIKIGGNVKANNGNVEIGNTIYNQSQQVTPIISLQEFMARLQDLQDRIADFKQQPDLLPKQQEILEIVEGQVTEAIEEAKKLKPKPARIKDKLNEAEAAMSSLAKSVTAAVGLGTAIASVGQIALKLFGR